MNNSYKYILFIVICLSNNCYCIYFNPTISCPTNTGYYFDPSSKCFHDSDVFGNAVSNTHTKKIIISNERNNLYVDNIATIPF